LTGATLMAPAMLVIQAARHQERERAITKVLEATKQERIRLAADLHDGPVQELTALSYGLERVDRRGSRPKVGMPRWSCWASRRTT
jgi:signal transduction histidine kinase